MNPNPETRRRRDYAAWSGWALSGLLVLALLADAAVKIIILRHAPASSVVLGWKGDMATPLGYVLLVCTALYAWPRTAVLGAILLTGYLGGAVATHLRVGSPLLSHVLFGAYLGLAAWGGLYLRDPRLRRLLPWRAASDHPRNAERP